jgi:hypothetical protein
MESALNVHHHVLNAKMPILVCHAQLVTCYKESYVNLHAMLDTTTTTTELALNAQLDAQIVASPLKPMELWHTNATHAMMDSSFKEPPNVFKDVSLVNSSTTENAHNVNKAVPPARMLLTVFPALQDPI